MKTITFDLDDTQEAEANKVLTQRQANDPDLTLDTLCQREAVYALGLSPEQQVAKKRSKVTETLANLSDTSLDKLLALANAETPPDAIADSPIL